MMEFEKILTVMTSSLFLILTGCGDIQQTSSTRTQGTAVGNELIASVGAAVLEIVNVESLPNAFGGADIFGRTRPTGTTTLIYVGRSGNNANFVRRDVEIQSTKTTMNSSPIVIQNSSQTNFSGNFGMTNFSGIATTTGAPIFLPPNTPQDMITGIRETFISVPLIQGRNSITIGGKTLAVIEASANQIRYTIEP